MYFIKGVRTIRDRKEGHEYCCNITDRNDKLLVWFQRGQRNVTRRRTATRVYSFNNFTRDNSQIVPPPVHYILLERDASKIEIMWPDAWARPEFRREREKKGKPEDLVRFIQVPVCVRAAKKANSNRITSGILLASTGRGRLLDTKT